MNKYSLNGLQTFRGQINIFKDMNNKLRVKSYENHTEVKNRFKCTRIFKYYVNC